MPPTNKPAGPDKRRITPDGFARSVDEILFDEISLMARRDPVVEPVRTYRDLKVTKRQDQALRD